MTEKTLYTEQDLAEAWGVSRWHVRGLRKSGALPSVRLGSSRLIRFSRETVERFVRDLEKEQQTRGVRSLRKLAAEAQQ